MKSIKIRGITGMPLFLTQFRGWLDGKRGIVTLVSDHYPSHYIEKKLAIYHAFLHGKYRDLETHTAPFHEESAALVVEYNNANKKIGEDDESPTGRTASSYARKEEQIAGVKPQLRARVLAIETRLAHIDEQLIRAIGETEDICQEAEKLTIRRIQAYLYGASIATRSIPPHAEYKIGSIEIYKKPYIDRHKENDAMRRAILTADLKEANADGTTT